LSIPKADTAIGADQINLKLSTLFDGKGDISKSGRNAKPEKYQSQPRLCIESPIQIYADGQTDENGQGNLETQAAIVGQFSEITPGFSFHSKERLSFGHRSCLFLLMDRYLLALVSDDL
jgi:hypothetical protein